MGENNTINNKKYEINGRGYYMPPFGIMQLAVIQGFTSSIVKDGKDLRFSDFLTPENIAKFLSYMLSYEGKSWSIDIQKSIEIDMIAVNIETELVIEILNDFFDQNPKLMSYFESIFGVLGLLLTAAKPETAQKIKKIGA